VSTFEQSSVAPIATSAPSGDPVVSVVIPCLNEEENIERCVKLALDVM
jgi:cellulose synthase/poly-beta-1,6-N-acetylglucosamine synthase-like glycosyltransferase